MHFMGQNSELNPTANYTGGKNQEESGLFCKLAAVKSNPIFGRFLSDLPHLPSGASLVIHSFNRYFTVHLLCAGPVREISNTLMNQTPSVSSMSSKLSGET